MPPHASLPVLVLVIITPLALTFGIAPSTMIPPAYRLRPYDPSREDDRSSLEEICANVYGGGDYLPKIASAYAADPACSFLGLTKSNNTGATADAREDGDEIVAVANYRRLPAQSSAWIEGVRTHPDYRNQGLASALMRSLVGMAKRESDGAPTNLLTCTSQSNAGMLRALDKVGFVQCNAIRILSFYRLKELPGWKSGCDEPPQPLLDALDLRQLVSPSVKISAKMPSWRRISSEGQLLDTLRRCQTEGCCGYLPGLYEYIVPGPNRLDLKHSMDWGLVLALDDVVQEQMQDNEDANNSNRGITEGKPGQAILALTQDKRISSLKSKWVCSIVASTQVAFEVALWHAHSPDVASRMKSFQQGNTKDSNEGDIAMNGHNEPTLPFCLVFDDAVPLIPGTLAHALPRTEDECIVLSCRI